MADRTYCYFIFPIKTLGEPSARAALCRIFTIFPEVLARELAEQPLPDAALGQDDRAVRMVDGVPCLVCEDIEADRGGWDYEDDLQDVGIPYLHRHNAGQEYGPERSVFVASQHVAIRCDANGDPIAGLQMVDGHAVADPEELADLETYVRLKALLLGAGTQAMPSA